jgi:hypothetical protein
MELPSKIKIGGRTYDIVMRDRLKEDGSDRCGSILFGQHKIIIDNGMVLEAKEQTLVHEIVEGIIYQNDLDISHRNLSIIAESLYQVLKDNNLRF